MPVRVFVSQSTIDEWVASDQVDLQGDVITLRSSGHTLRLSPAAYFKSIAGGAADAHALIGRVKDHGAIDALGGEAYMSSVVIGEDAYDVEPGFLAIEEPAGDDGGMGVLGAMAVLAG